MTMDSSVIAACTGDWHFGVRDEECERMGRWLVDDAAATGARLLAHGGDVFEQRSAPWERNAAIRTFCYAGDRMACVVVKGNHDADGDLDVFASLRTRYPILVADRPRIVVFDPAPMTFRDLDQVEATCPDQLLLCLLPWPRRAQLVASIGGKPKSPEEINALAQQALLGILSGFRNACAAHGGPSMLLAHADVVGAIGGDDQPLMGCDLMVPPAMFAEVGATFVSLAHQHRPQQVAPGVVYNGSHRRTAFGKVHVKSYGRVALRPGNYDLQQIEMPCAPMHLLEALWQDGNMVPSETRDGHVQLIDPSTLPTILPGAEIRYRYHVASDQRAGAKAMAQRVKAQLEADGAARVQVDERIIPVHRDQGGQSITQARSDWDKVQAWLRHTAQWPEAARLVRLDALLAEARAKLPPRPARAVAGGLRLDAIRLRGMIAYPEEVELVLDQVPGDLVAIIGDNGAGKSTLIGAFPGVLYRTFPDRPGGLARWAKARDAYMEVTVTSGDATHRLQINVDAVSKQSLCYVFRADGQPAHPDIQGGTTAFDAWVEQHMPSARLFLASAFASQKRKNDPVAALPSERKAMLIELLDLAWLQELADAVAKMISTPGAKGEKPSGQQVVIAALTTGWEAARADADKLPAAKQAVADADTALAQATARADQLDADVARLDGDGATWLAAKGDLDSAAAAARAAAQGAALALVPARQAVTDATRRLAAVRKRIAENQAIVDSAADMAAAQAKIASLTAADSAARTAADGAAQALRAATAALEQARRDEQAALRKLDAARSTLSAARQAQVSARSRVEEAQAAIADLPYARRAAERVAVLQGQLTEARAVQDAARRRIADSARLDAERGQQLVQLRARLDRAQQTLDTHAGQAQLRHDVPCGGQGEYAGCKLLGHAVAADAAIPAATATRDAARGACDLHQQQPLPDWYVAPDARDTAQAEADEAFQAVADELDAEQSLGAQLPQLERAAAAADTAAQVLGARDTDVQAADSAATAADTTWKATSAALHHATTGHQQAQAADAGASRTARDAQQALQDAQLAAARVGQVDAARRELDRAQGDLQHEEATDRDAQQALQLATTADQQARQQQQTADEAVRRHVAAKPVDPPRAAAKVAREAVSAAHGKVGQATAARDAALAATDKAQGLRADLDAAHQRLGDMQLLATALGRDGVQSLEIDAAAPELSATINALLAEGWGDRFTVDLVTKVPTSDGKGEKEGLWIWVIDNAPGKGSEGDANETLSIGEAAVIREALQLAIAMRNARAAGVSGGTLVRDEADRDLTKDNCVRYVRMLRQAARLGGFGKVLFVTHDEEAQAQADARVRIADGRLVIQ